MSDLQTELGAFRSVPRTGVIFVTSEASRLGFRPDDPDWCNLGQGQPECGELPDAPARIERISVSVNDQEYSPIAGLWELREAVAGTYNQLYRRGHRSQYSAENVAICGGGRLALARAAVALGHVNLGHFLPDYTAYEELLDVFRSFTPIPILLDATRGYAFSPDELRHEMLGRGLGALLLSNPCNPTGKVIHDAELASWISAAREFDCTLLIDEFYSNYIWVNRKVSPATVSAAEYIEDVDRDPVVIFNGLTKNWRYPGWRISWTLGPKSVIEAVSSAGSFLDGGASRPLQRAAIPLLSLDHMKRETIALQKTFAQKRRLMIDRLRASGIRLDNEPDGTFYVWGNLEQLPPPLNDGMQFFRAALQYKVIVVPGEFFDVNPGNRRGRASRFKSYARFSFGPSYDLVEKGLLRLSQVIRSG